MLDRSDALVFFGITGDLAFKQIFPALQAMIRRGHFGGPIIGVARSSWDVERLRARAHDSLAAHGPVDEATFAMLSARLRYVGGNYDDPTTFQRLREALAGCAHPLHYLAIPPNLFETVIGNLASSGCAKDARVVVEKPFGRDLDSAVALNETLLKVFPEPSIFRIDHFLGKEPVQNLVYFRFGNSFLEPIWNRNHVDSIQVTMAENFGVLGRGKFYEEAGAIRDVVQNHLLQIVALLAMEAPAGHDPDASRDEKTRILKAIHPLTPTDVVKAQFKGYRSEPGVATDSRVETFAALRLQIDTWRWAGVPFYVRAGKSMPVTATEIMVFLKRPPPIAFNESDPGHPNYLRFRLSPEVEISLGARVKAPGEAMVGEDAELIARESFIDAMLPYERLLGDAMNGDPRLFASEESVEAAWRVVDPILDGATPVVEYEPGTWGPAEAGSIVEGEHGWHDPVVETART